MSLTSAIARFICSDFQPSSEALDIARRSTIDTLAVMMAGRHEPSVLTVENYAKRCEESRGRCSALLDSPEYSSRHAALINGTAAHALDYDDVAPIGHPGAVLVSALLAAGEPIGVSGEAFLDAYVVGYEVWAELLKRERNVHHDKGWHPTAVFGTVGAAAAVIRLRRLPFQLARHALGISASMSSGLVANFGSMAKAYHIGRAAASGVEAVDLAMCGMTAANDVLESNKGFLVSFSPEGNVDVDTPAFSQPARHLETLGISIKHYPVCYATHRAIDAARALACKYDFAPDDIRRIDIKVGVTQAGMLKYRQPKTAMQAKFSLEFAVSCALHQRDVTLRHLQERYFGSPAICRLIEATTVSYDYSRSAYSSIFSEADSIVVHLADGRILQSGDIQYPRGSFRLSFNEDDLKQKFLNCMGGESAACFYEYLSNFDQIASVSHIAQRYQKLEA